MGTTYHVKYYPSEKSQSATAIHEQIEQRLVDINQLMSTYIPDSELSLLNKAEANVEYDLSPDNVEVLTEAIRLHKLSEGAFDVTVGPLVNLWGFGPDGRVTTQPSAEKLAESKEWVGIDKVKLMGNAVVKSYNNTYIDFSSIAKGFGVDELAEVLESESITTYMVEVGGELRVKGVKPNGKAWTVAIEKPEIATRQAQLILPLGDTGMATSGDYRNYFEENGIRFSHTIDPTTGAPIKHNLASVTVLHPSSMTADALATALNVLGPEKGLEIAEKYDIAAYMLVKSENGFEEVVSTSFRPYLQHK
jgi:thiamine biosynthesis lipoprotein